MRSLRDIGLALGIGVLWAVAIELVIGLLVALHLNHPAGMDALARGDAATFVAVILLGDIAIFAIPSLLAGYLITRLMTRPRLFAFVAGTLPFLSGVYSFVRMVAEGSSGDALRVYMALNAILLLVAIPAGVVLIQSSTRWFPGAAPRAD